MNIRWILTGLTMVTVSACGSADKTPPRGNGGAGGSGGEPGSSSSSSAASSSSGKGGGGGTGGGMAGAGGGGMAGAGGSGGMAGAGGGMAGAGGSGGMAGAGGGNAMDICTSGPKAVWARAFADQSSQAARVRAYALDTAADGSFVVGGDIHGSSITFGANTPYSTQINGGQGSDYALLLRLADDGSFRWGKAYSSANGARILFARPLADGSILIAGDFTGRVSFDLGLPSQIQVYAADGNNDPDIFLARIGVDGNVIWAKNIGSVGNETTYGMRIRKDGRIALAGRFSQDLTFNPGMPDAITLTRPAGNLLDSFVALLDENGHALWARAVGGKTNSDRIWGMVVTADNGIAISGEFWGNTTFDGPPAPLTLTSPSESSAYIAHYKDDGTLDWAHMVEGGKSLGYFVGEDASGRLLMTGFTQAMNVFGTGEPSQTTLPMGGNFVARYLPNGNFLDVFRTGAVHQEDDMMLMPSGHVITAGTWYNSASFVLPGGETTFTANSATRPYLACSGQPGLVHWVRHHGEPGEGRMRAMTLAPNGDIVVTGQFGKNLTIDPDGPNPITLTNSTTLTANSFIARYGKQ